MQIGKESPLMKPDFGDLKIPKYLIAEHNLIIKVINVNKSVASLDYY